ncbi:MAG: tRNA pseudouridine(55) synthase TruB [Helicobacteraceae bacterium]|jgi:tRNA pseudouridine55 synthase|nr:tRNA pseudouridine(55) synthase TruB [Helicobacteraceae bacterium]
MNALFAADKPAGASSNAFLTSLKKKYGVRSAGYSGTLDPFASGALIVAFGQFTRLFSYLDKTPKRYAATLILGAKSETLDIEKITEIAKIAPLESCEIQRVLQSFLGVSMQTPPIYSAIKIAGRRAYKLARSGENVEIKPRPIEVYEIALADYSHPFLSFECAVSEGCYVRSLGRDIAAALETDGALKSLARLSEGKFAYEGEKFLNPLEFLKIPRNEYLGGFGDILLGRKLAARNFAIQTDGEYYVTNGEFLVIVEIAGESAIYRAGKMKLN